MKILPRKNVLNFEPYVPGMPIEDVRRDTGLRRIDKLASNENPLPPSPRVIGAVKGALCGVNRYPDGSGLCLKKALASKLGVRTSNILLGSGSDEIIEIIGKTFLERSDEIIVSEHAFIRYKMAADLMNCRAKTVKMRSFTHDLPAMKKAVTPRTRVIFIANPNNPTGTYVNEGEVREFLKGLRANIITVFDEAYCEYVTEKDYPQTLGYVKKGLPVVVLRTFSKVYGLAGLRVGYGIARRDIVGFMERVRPPFNVSSVAQAAAVESLKDRDRVCSSRRLVAKERQYMENALKGMGVPFVPSAANFILVKTGNGRKVFKRLVKRGVIVRAMDEYGFPSYIRVTVGLPAENKKFINSLKQVL